MQAIVWTAYGSPDVLELRDVEKPHSGPKEILIKIHAATVTMGDCEMRRFDMPAWSWLPIRLYMGLIKPRIRTPGQELAGVVEAVGSEITRLKPGDEVFTPTEMRFGALAEYVCLSERYAAIKPPNMSFEEAATIPVGGLNALHFLRRGKVESGHKILLYGAGGGIGTAAVQIAKSFGAEVTAVDSEEKLDMLTSIGADHVIDYRQQDFTQSGEVYDAIIDIVGKSPFSGSVNSLTPTGRYVFGNPRMPGMLKGLWTSLTSDRKVVSALAAYRFEDMEFLRALMEEGKLKTVIDRRYPLAEIAAAHRYVETGRKTGNVVINIARGSTREG